MRWALLSLSLLFIGCSTVDTRPRTLCEPISESGYRSRQPCGSDDNDTGRPRLGYEPG